MCSLCVLKEYGKKIWKEDFNKQKIFCSRMMKTENACLRQETFRKYQNDMRKKKNGHHTFKAIISILNCSYVTLFIWISSYYAFDNHLSAYLKRSFPCLPSIRLLVYSFIHSSNIFILIRAISNVYDSNCVLYIFAR